MCRCQRLKGNRIAADFGNNDSSNINEKPSLSCNVNKATKKKEIMINGILIHCNNRRIGAICKEEEGLNRIQARKCHIDFSSVHRCFLAI